MQGLPKGRLALPVAGSRKKTSAAFARSHALKELLLLARPALRGEQEEVNILRGKRRLDLAATMPPRFARLAEAGETVELGELASR